MGEETAFLLATNFGTLAMLRDASEDTLSGISGIGPIIGRAVAEWFKSFSNRALLVRLGKHLKVRKVVTPARGPLTGQTVVITGTLPTLSREEAEAKVRGAGGKVAASVSSKTSFIVAGKNPGSKFDSAEQLRVPIFSEEDFLIKLRT